MGTVRNWECEEQDMRHQKDVAEGSAWQFMRKDTEEEPLHPTEWSTCSNLLLVTKLVSTHCNCWAEDETQTERSPPQVDAYTQTDLLKSQRAIQTLSCRELQNLGAPLEHKGRDKCHGLQLCQDREASLHKVLTRQHTIWECEQEIDSSIKLSRRQGDNPALNPWEMKVS